MKKSTLFVAALALSFTAAHAERIEDAYVTNLIVNGDFEDTAYVQEQAYSWIDDIFSLSVLPGWTMNTSGIWNGTMEIIAEEGDGFARPEEDQQFLLIRCYHENGWTTMSLSTIADGLTVGKEYTLDFLVAHIFEAADWVEKNIGFRICQVDGDKAGKEIVNVSLKENGTDLENYEYTFKAPAEKVYVEFYFGSLCWEGGDNGETWMQLDNVRLYDKAAAEEAKAGIDSVAVDTDCAPEYYNLNGIRVNPQNAKGVIICKQGSHATKIVR